MLEKSRVDSRAPVYSARASRQTHETTTAAAQRRRRRRRMAAVPSFFIQSPPVAAAGCCTYPDPHHLDNQPPQLQSPSATKCDYDDLPQPFELRDSAARQSLHNHVEMIAADRDPMCPPVERHQHLPAAYRSPTAAATMDVRTSNYPNLDAYYRTASEFAGYQYPSSLIARPFGNGYCRSAYADECVRRYPVEPESYFHPDSAVQPAWARLSVGGVFPFPVPQEFGLANSGGRQEYRTPAATTRDSCRTELQAAAELRPPFSASTNHGCSGQAPGIDGSSSGGHRRRPATVNDQSPPLRSSVVAGTSKLCCRLDSLDGGTERDQRVLNAGDVASTAASSNSTTSSTAVNSTPVVVYPWMKKLHSRSNSGSGKSSMRNTDGS